MPPKREHSERDYARILFTREGKGVSEISTLTGIPAATLYKWKHDDEWETERSHLRLNPRAIAADIELSIIQIYEAKREANNGKAILTPGDADAIAKLVKSRNDLLKNSNYIGIAFDVMDRFQKLLARDYPKLVDSNELGKIVGAFLKDLMAEL